jgi:hypothetical protein
MILISKMKVKNESDDENRHNGMYMGENNKRRDTEYMEVC